MRGTGVRLILALLVLIFSIILLAWGFLPDERVIQRQIILPTEMQIPTPESFQPSAAVGVKAPLYNETVHGNESANYFTSTQAQDQKGASQAIPESRLLTLDSPRTIRAGDSGVVRLTFEVAENGNLTPTIPVSGNVLPGDQVTLPNIYDSYNVLAEARLDMAGVDLRPNDTISESLLPSQKVTFYWSVLPGKVGRYNGTVWFYLRYLPKSGGVESRQTLSAQPVEIESVSFLGLSANLERWLGLIGLVISLLLGLPWIESILRRTWKDHPGQLS